MPDAPEYSRKNPFPSALLAMRALSLEGSPKVTAHFELSLAGSGLAYDCGDALGVVPQNCPDLVGDLVEALGFSGDEVVPGNDGSDKPIREALTTDYAITTPSKKFFKYYNEKADDGEIASVLEANDSKLFADFIWGKEIIDFILARPDAKFEPAEFVGLLGKLQPRLYSIASSLKAHPDEVHLTVARVGYDSAGRARKGVCSSYLCDRIGIGDKMPVFVHVAKHFKMPEDDAAPMIMVGPGTGIAPFRAFLEERKATGASGKNWLFFGNPYRKTDFFYEDEFAAAEQSGLLAKFTTAFSRDQEHKIYVQHRMLENGADLWAWLQDGAYFYVCGDASRMAKDVDDALLAIAQEHGGLDAEEAAEYIGALKKEKRYQRDVY
ncbi:MAG: sulfite reductase subunit alpha [Verrucomicrobiales bacterium]